MNSHKTKSILRSFIIVPLLASTVSMSAFTASVNTAIAPKEVVAEVVVSQEEAALQVEREARAAAIDAYYTKYKMPLAGHGMKFVEVAEKYNLDWRLLPAIAVREQSGGLRLPHNCPGKTKNYNAFGWGSGKICFTSFDQAIETVGMKLGTLRYYKGKSVTGILNTYNPPSVVANYHHEVIAIMNKIGTNKI